MRNARRPALLAESVVSQNIQLYQSRGRVSGKAERTSRAAGERHERQARRREADRRLDLGAVEGGDEALEEGDGHVEVGVQVGLDAVEVDVIGLCKVVSVHRACEGGRTLSDAVWLATRGQ